MPEHLLKHMELESAEPTGPTEPTETFTAPFTVATAKASRRRKRPEAETEQESRTLTQQYLHDLSREPIGQPDSIARRHEVVPSSCRSSRGRVRIEPRKPKPPTWELSKPRPPTNFSDSLAIPAFRSREDEYADAFDDCHPYFDGGVDAYSDETARIVKTAYLAAKATRPKIIMCLLYVQAMRSLIDDSLSGLITSYEIVFRREEEGRGIIVTERGQRDTHDEELTISTAETTAATGREVKRYSERPGFDYFVRTTSSSRQATMHAKMSIPPSSQRDSCFLALLHRPFVFVWEPEPGRIVQGFASYACYLRLQLQREAPENMGEAHSFILEAQPLGIKDEEVGIIDASELLEPTGEDVAIMLSASKLHGVFGYPPKTPPMAERSSAQSDKGVAAVDADEPPLWKKKDVGGKELIDLFRKRCLPLIQAGDAAKYTLETATLVEELHATLRECETFVQAMQGLIDRSMFDSVKNYEISFLRREIYQRKGSDVAVTERGIYGAIDRKIETTTTEQSSEKGTISFVRGRSPAGGPSLMEGDAKLKHARFKDLKLRADFDIPSPGVEVALLQRPFVFAWKPRGSTTMYTTPPTCYLRLEIRLLALDERENRNYYFLEAKPLSGNLQEGVIGALDLLREGDTDDFAIMLETHSSFRKLLKAVRSEKEAVVAHHPIDEGFGDFGDFGGFGSYSDETAEIAKNAYAAAKDRNLGLLRQSYVLAMQCLIDDCLSHLITSYDIVFHQAPEEESEVTMMREERGELGTSEGKLKISTHERTLRLSTGATGGKSSSGRLLVSDSPVRTTMRAKMTIRCLSQGKPDVPSCVLALLRQPFVFAWTPQASRIEGRPAPYACYLRLKLQREWGEKFGELNFGLEAQPLGVEDKKVGIIDASELLQPTERRKRMSQAALRRTAKHLGDFDGTESTGNNVAIMLNVSQLSRVFSQYSRVYWRPPPHVAEVGRMTATSSMRSHPFRELLER